MAQREPNLRTIACDAVDFPAPGAPVMPRILGPSSVIREAAREASWSSVSETVGGEVLTCCSDQSEGRVHREYAGGFDH